MEPLISIIVPVYNAESYLEKCIKCLCGQTYSNIEILLTDDGSNDKSPQICDLWAKRDSRIHVIHKENGGPSDARNAGIERAKGEYLAFVDSDDYIEENMFQDMMEAICRTGAELACCGRYVESGRKNTIMHTCKSEKVLDSSAALKELYTYGCIEEAVWDKVFHRALFDGIRFPRGELNEEIMVMLRIISSCQNIVCVPRPLYHYCQNPGSITKAGYHDKLSICMDHIDQVTAYSRKYYPELNKSLKVFQARYSLALVTTLLGTEGACEYYQKDYLYYMSMLRASFTGLLLSRNFSWSVKIRCLLILSGCYCGLRRICRRGIG